MADQSAIRIPQGGLGVNVIDTVTTFHCSPSGDDINGDGSISNPFNTPGRALNDIERMFFTDRGHAIIRCHEGTYDLINPIVVNNTSHKTISIMGDPGLSFYLQEVTNYQYDAAELPLSTHGNGSLVDNRITVKLANAGQFTIPPTSPVSPSTNGIGIGDYVMFRDETNTSAGYYPSQVDNSVASEGITGATGDARSNVLGCFEIIGINSSDNTITFRSRGKNFLHRLGSSQVNADDGSFSVGDSIYAGGYQNAPLSASHETGDPTGKYGSLAGSGIDTTTGTIITDHQISATIIKTVFKYRRKASSGRSKTHKGLVVMPNSSLSTIQNVVFQGDVKYKHFNEMNPASANGEGILVYKNSSLGAKPCINVGICGFYAGMAAHTDSMIHADRVTVSDCSFGLVADQNSSIYAKGCVLTGCDIAGVLANGTSNIKTQNTIVGSAGYSPLTIDLDQAGTGISTLSAGERIAVEQGTEQFSYVEVVWNSYTRPYTSVNDPRTDPINYYPLNTANQIYLKAVHPLAGETDIPPDLSGNEVPPPRILSNGSQLFSVGSGLLPENSIPIDYVPVDECGTSNEDLSGGVCKPPGFYGDRFDRDTDGVVNFNDMDTGEGGEEGGEGGEGGNGDDCLPPGCLECQSPCSCLSTECGGDGSGDCDSQICNGEDRCCICEDYYCDNLGGACPENNPDICCLTPVECECIGSPCLPQCAPPPNPGPGGEYCQWCNECGSVPANTEACECACASDPFCCDNPNDCSCGENPECCDVDCTQPVNCSGHGCCCNCPGGQDCTDPFTNKPCYCNNTACGDDVGGTPCPNGLNSYVECFDCDDGDCICPPGTDNEGTCDRPCNDVEPDTTIYRFIDHPMGIGFFAHNNSSINAEKGYVTLLRNQGFLSIENSNIDADYGFVRGCAGSGFLASANSNINANRSAAIRTRGGYAANTNSNVQAVGSKSYDNAHYNYSAVNDAIVNCSQSISFIGRTVNSGTENANTIISSPKIYSGMAIAHGIAKSGSFINKTGITEQTTDPVTPNSADKWSVDSSSHVEPSNLD